MTTQAAMKTPGCFGSILSFSETDATCSACLFAKACEAKCEQVLREARGDQKVEAIVTKLNKDRTQSGKEPIVAPAKPVKAGKVGGKPRGSRELTAPEQAIVAKVSTKKPAEHLTRLLRRGITPAYILKMMGRGENPFDAEPPKYLQAACDALLAGGYTRTQLAKRFQDLGMSHTTAYSHVSIANTVLSAMGVIVETADKRFVIREVK